MNKTAKIIALVAVGALVIWGVVYFSKKSKKGTPPANTTNTGTASGSTTSTGTGTATA